MEPNERDSPKVLSRGVIVNMSSIFGLTGAPSAAPAAPYSTRLVYPTVFCTVPLATTDFVRLYPVNMVSWQ